MSSVIIIIHRIRIIIAEIYSINIINIPVLIIINIISGNFSGIFPHISCQIRMIIIYTCIYYCYNNIISCRNIPSFNSVNVSVSSSTALSCVIHSPKFAKTCIVRYVQSIKNIIWFCIFYLTILLKFFYFRNNISICVIQFPNFHSDKLEFFF